MLGVSRWRGSIRRPDCRLSPRKEDLAPPGWGKGLSPSRGRFVDSSPSKAFHPHGGAIAGITAPGPGALNPTERSIPPGPPATFFRSLKLLLLEPFTGGEALGSR